MWGEVVRLLKIRNQEDFFGKRLVMMVLITLLFGFLNTQGHRVGVFAHLILLCIISLNANQILSLFNRKGCEYIVVVNSRSESNKFWTLCFASVVENLYYLLLLILQVFLVFNSSLIMSFFISSLHFLFALALGILTSQLVVMNIGIITLIAYYIMSFFMATSWAFDENWRFLSLTLQLNNTRLFNQSNNLSIFAMTIVMALIGKILFSKYKIRWKSILVVILFLMVAIGGIVSSEISFNNSRNSTDYNIMPNQSTDSIKVYYKSLEESQIEIMGLATTEVVRGMEKYGAKDSNIERIYFDKYYISLVPNLYKTRPIPVAIEDKSLKINVFSDAVINCDEPEIFSEMLNRVYDQLDFNTPNYDNKYIHQIIAANREFILLESYEKVKINDKKALIAEAERIINKRKTDEPTDSNYVKKMMIIMHEQYPEKIPTLYRIVQSELPKSNDDFRDLFVTNFPELTSDQELMELVRTN